MFGGLEELAPHVGVAAHEFDPWLILGPCRIRAVAITLDDVDEFADLLIFHGSLEEIIEPRGVAPFMPVEEHAAAGNAGRPEVALLGFSGAGFKIGNGGFVDLPVGTSPVFILDVPVNDGEPVRSQQGPIAKGFTVNVNSEAGEDLFLPVVGQVTDEAVVNDLGNQARSRDAAVL